MGAYPILTFPEVPEVDVVMMPRPYDPPLGAGESASVPSAAAIANAVFDATGIRFRELPITSDKLREALNGPDAERQAAPPKKKKRGKWWFGGAAGLFGAVLGIAGSALPWRAEIAPVATPGAGTGRPPRWSAAASWPLPETARFAIPHRKGRPTPAGWRWRRRSARSTAPTLPRTWQPASATGRLPRSIGRCARASPATAAICIRHFLTPHSVK